MAKVSWGEYRRKYGNPADCSGHLCTEGQRTQRGGWKCTASNNWLPQCISPPPHAPSLCYGILQKNSILSVGASARLTQLDIRRHSGEMTRGGALLCVACSADNNKIGMWSLLQWWQQLHVHLYRYCRTPRLRWWQDRYEVEQCGAVLTRWPACAVCVR